MALDQFCRSPAQVAQLVHPDAGRPGPEPDEAERLRLIELETTPEQRLRLIEIETTPEQRLRSAAINQLVREQTAGKCDREYREPVLSSRGTPARYFGATLSCVRGVR